MNLASRRPTRDAADPVTARNWREYAACTGNPDLFFPDGSNRALARIQERQAQQVCFRCPVKAMCGAWALDEGVEAGVWGGMTAGERHQVLQDRGQEVGVLPVDLWPDEPDPEAVDAYLTGKRSDVADIDRLAAICAAVDAGMAFRDIDRLHGIALRSTSKFMGKMREAFAKDGRRFPLSDQWASNVRTFTNEQVREIRERAAAGGRSAKELAAEYGVHPKTMGSMLTGVSYPEAGGPLRAGRPRRSSVVSELCAQDMEVAA